MRSNTIRRERGHWPRSLVLVGLLTVGTACGGSGNTAQSPKDQPAAATERTSATPSDAGGRQPVIPSPLGASPTAKDVTGLSARSGVQAPPAPDLGTRRPVAPPNTVSLEELHRQGRTHVLR